MGVYAELRGFILAHRGCGVPSGSRDPETATGYRLRIGCPCGARFDRWLAADDADADRLRAALRAFEEPPSPGAPAAPARPESRGAGPRLDKAARGRRA